MGAPAPLARPGCWPASAADRARVRQRSPGEVVAALAAKYTAPGDLDYLPDADPAFDVVYAVRPRSAMAWRLADYVGSQRRWARGD